ncbi:ABC transporter permease [Rhodococcus rhodochrous]|uniref:ABC transporter permease n=1 Tax=Rhodococcus rhodochrous TaxID=1829 RepID=UPI001E4E3E2A|nr:ABC transporter permease [Rhodococcus rhodochrous]MCD2124607.1 ABC transporter permease [Rhodococcus rhodochrous]MDJ0021403.1 ABC transporter permease [Rhodococcus rhodochrous]
MITYLARRIGAMLATLFVASFVVYGALYLAPGDPVSTLISGNVVTPELIASVREQYGLDRPFLVRYGEWLGGMFTGDFGQSLRFQQDVSALMASRLPTTLLLVVMAGTLTVVAGIALGSISALRPGPVDRTVLNATSFVAALPVFVTAFAFLFIFGVKLRWFPVSGGGDSLGDHIFHLILPSVTLAFALTALITRVTRASVKEQMVSEHVAVAEGRGVSGLKLYSRHVFRNALTPILTQSGIVIAGLLVSSQIVEVAFGLDGLGSLLVQSVQNMDFPVVQAITLLVVFAYVFTNMVIDFLLPLIDPRIQIGGRSQ